MPVFDSCVFGRLAKCRERHSHFALSTYDLKTRCEGPAKEVAGPKCDGFFVGGVEVRRSRSRHGKEPIFFAFV